MSEWPSRPMSGTDCTEALLRVFEFLDGEMGPADQAKISAHLDACSHCLTQYNIDTTLKALIRRSCPGESAPVTLRMSIMTQITMSTSPLAASDPARLDGPDLR